MTKSRSFLGTVIIFSWILRLVSGTVTDKILRVTTFLDKDVPILVIHKTSIWQSIKHANFVGRL